MKAHSSCILPWCLWFCTLSSFVAAKSHNLLCTLKSSVLLTNTKHEKASLSFLRICLLRLAKKSINPRVPTLQMTTKWLHLGAPVNPSATLQSVQSLLALFFYHSPHVSESVRLNIPNCLARCFWLLPRSTVAYTGAWTVWRPLRGPLFYR